MFSCIFVLFGTVLPAFFGKGNVFGFEIIKYFRHATTFFKGEMNLGIVSELFKHAPVHLNRLRVLWL